MLSFGLRSVTSQAVNPPNKPRLNPNKICLVFKLLLEKQIHHQIEVVADMNDLRKLVSEYGKIGSNLNQIAKHFNSSESQSHAVKNEIHQCITDLFQLRKEVLKLAGGMDGLNCDPMSFDKTRYYLVG